jgi:hypothetical protein
MSEIFFHETQRPPTILLLLILCPLAGVTLIFDATSRYQQFILDVPFGDKPMSDVHLIFLIVFTLLITVGVTWMFLSSRLELKVDKFRISYRYFPFISRWRHINASVIKSWEIRRFFPLGFGIHFGFRYTTFNVRGNTALKLELKKGRSVKIGTRRADELRRILEKYYR